MFSQTILIIFIHTINIFQKICLPKIGTTPPQPTKEQPFQRKLSRREKKELKKQEKLRRANEANELNSSVAEKLYTGLCAKLLPEKMNLV